jgi:hypothetical protein
VTGAPRRDDGKSRTLRLEDGDPIGLEFRGDHEHVERSEDACDVGAMPEECDALAHTERSGERLEGGAQRTITRQDHLEPSLARGRRGEAEELGRIVLLLDQAANAANEEVVVGYAQLAPEGRRRPVAGTLGDDGRYGIDGDTVRDDLQPVRRDPVVPAETLAQLTGDHDDPAHQVRRDPVPDSALVRRSEELLREIVVWAIGNVAGEGAQRSDGGANTEALANALAAIFARRDRAEMGTRGRARVIERFGADRMARAYEDLYMDVLNGA